MATHRDADAVWAVVIPVFEDGLSFSHLCRKLAAAKIPFRLEIIVVDDGSVNDPPTMDAMTQAGLSGQIIRLKRNVGHQVAIAVGLVCAAADAGYAGAVVMDCDGEDKPEDIPRLIQGVGANHDIAVARRGKRTETVIFCIFYLFYRYFFRLLTGRTIRSGNFCALSMRALSRLAAMQETRFHLAATLMKSRLRWLEITSDRGHRYHGRSRMNFLGLVLHGIRAATVFDDAVLTRMGAVCVGAAVSGGIGFVIAGTLKLLGYTSPGWLTAVTGFLIVVFLQVALLSLVALMMNGLGYRSPAEVEAAALSLILERETNRIQDNA